MAGQEIDGDLWDQYLGLGLLPPSARIGFRALFPPQYKIWGAETHV